MVSFFVRRILHAIPALIGAVTLLFLLLRLIPGDPAQAMLGTQATAEDLARLRHQLGLDRPLIVQYGIYLADFARGDWGVSLATQTPVLHRVREALPHTLSLCGAAVLVMILISVPAGVLCAVKRDSWVDYSISVAVFLFMSMPQFWLGLLMLLFFSYYFGLFPIYGIGQAGNIFDQLHHLVLPALSLGISFLGLSTRLTRSSMLEVLGQDYIRTARAKGLKEGRVIFKHALRNAMLSVVTVIGLATGQLLGGAVIIEVIFARPGLGTLIWDAILQRDYPQVQASVAVFAFFFIMVNLFTDLVYALLNPKIKLS
ncbi:MAG: ABC transporter permease [Deltaproteobacteria bacterium]|nr:ABC transporter permease [Deltaproteobacteria bacterium]MBW2120420.1 ABC transporter permease [Deltaproteobacteria bacterium]